MIKINNFKLNKSLIKFLKDPNTKRYLDTSNIKGLYEYANEFIKRDENKNMDILTPNITSVLYSIDIDPFDYLNNIPDDYLNWVFLTYEIDPIENLTIPGHIKKIGKRAFLYESIKNISLEEGVETLGDYSFSHIQDIESIILPRSLKYIGKRAFSGIKNDNILKYMGTKDEWYNIKKPFKVFDESDSAYHITCVDGQVECE